MNNKEIKIFFWANVKYTTESYKSDKQRLEKVKEERKHTHNGDKLVMR